MSVETDHIREQIAQSLYNRSRLSSDWPQWEELKWQDKITWFQQADYFIETTPFLNLAIPLAEHDKLVMLDDDQSMPTPRDKGSLCLLHYSTQIQDCGFKRVSPLGEKEE